MLVAVYAVLIRPINRRLLMMSSAPSRNKAIVFIKIVVSIRPSGGETYNSIYLAAENGLNNQSCTNVRLTEPTTTRLS